MIRSIIVCLLVLTVTVSTSAWEMSTVDATMWKPVEPPYDTNGVDGIRCSTTTRQSLDGYCNNLNYPKLGAVKSVFRRVCHSEYSGDGKNEMAGLSRPNARLLSNLVHGQPTPYSLGDPRGLSELTTMVGQFLNHETNDAESGQGVFTAGETRDIPVAANDPWADAAVPFQRMDYIPSGPTTPRQQVNARVSAWLDGSVVYSARAEILAQLREHAGGRLRVKHWPTGDFPANQTQPYFMAAPPGVPPNLLLGLGDFRGNEQPGLLVLQTLMVREHNFWCAQLARKYGAAALSDEELFQLARAIVRAELQILMLDLVSATIGAENFRMYVPPYGGYNPKAYCDPTPTYEYAVAALRFGHSTIRQDVTPLGADYKPCCGGPAPLQAVFFAPSYVLTHGVEPFLRSFLARTAEQVDHQCTDPIRNGGVDVVATDLARGRDVGLMSFLKCRSVWLNTKAPALYKFTDLDTVNLDAISRLSTTYKDVNDMDMFAGVLTEAHAFNSSVGPTTVAIIAEALTKFRDCDRFWFEKPGVFVPNDAVKDGQFRAMVREVGHLRSIILRNTQLKECEVPADAMFAFPTVPPPACSGLLGPLVTAFAEVIQAKLGLIGLLPDAIHTWFGAADVPKTGDATPLPVPNPSDLASSVNAALAGLKGPGAGAGAANVPDVLTNLGVNVGSPFPALFSSTPPSPAAPASMLKLP